MYNKPNDVIGRATAALFPKEESKPEAKGFRVATPSATTMTDDGSASKISLNAEERGKQVKQFATASGAAMHTKVVKVKRAGLRALHKAVSLLAPKNKKKNDKDNDS